VWLTFEDQIPMQWMGLFHVVYAACVSDAPMWCVNMGASAVKRVPYVQARDLGDGQLEVEMTSNRYLPTPLPAERLARMERIGWKAPTPDSSPNWHAIVPRTASGASLLAWMVVTSLVEVYGMDDDWVFWPSTGGEPISKILDRHMVSLPGSWNFYHGDGVKPEIPDWP
jgi:hypothetical protein